MIKFFRKIRQKLLDENKLSKYLLYAIGEIILVIIGILIALFINNKNEVRMVENKFITNLLQVQKELELNIENTNSSINYYLTKDNLIASVMADSLTTEDYYSDMKNINIKPSKGQGLCYIIFNTTQVNTLNNRVVKLNQNTDKLPNEFYPILEEINKIYSQFRTIVMDWNAKMLTLENSNIAKFSDNYNWFNKVYYFEKSNSEAFEYFVNDPIYKNLVSQYSFLSEEHFKSIKTFRNEGIKLHTAISDFLRLEAKTDSISNKFILDKELLDCYAGKYSFGSDSYFEITIKNNKLFLSYEFENLELTDISETKFVGVDNDFSITFENTNNCISNSFIFQQDGVSYKFIK
ncbi:hypothetical protein SB49_12685 [Sediminicola sp. YIK13]|uniref:hypothetical protein n=1 Tax=Sediminicola sp. YIK13 TaxID=1453352 RepID=UPI0007223E09|nr:hypothetical protein [Sediminicola sp. YIK13]ALM08565.1 hypothetical protein SB49_12685 [Sediminicola sp. YIK13]